MSSCGIKCQNLCKEKKWKERLISGTLEPGSIYLWDSEEHQSLAKSMHMNFKLWFPSSNLSFLFVSHTLLFSTGLFFTSCKEQSLITDSALLTDTWLFYAKYSRQGQHVFFYAYHTAANPILHQAGCNLHPKPAKPFWQLRQKIPRACLLPHLIGIILHSCIFNNKLQSSNTYYVYMFMCVGGRKHHSDWQFLFLVVVRYIATCI